MDERRVRLIKGGRERPGPVLYWMSRDQRARDNWALLFAREMAQRRGAPLAVLFCLVPEFLGATVRQYGFMLNGLREVARSLAGKGIPFFLRTGRPEKEVPAFMKAHSIGVLVTDFSPLKIKNHWVRSVSDRIGVPFYEVDAHNIVPCWLASPKQEYAAYTFRPKIRRALSGFLTEIPPLGRNPAPWRGKPEEADWEKGLRSTKSDRSVGEVHWLLPGERAAAKMLREFLRRKLAAFATLRNDPAGDGQSHLSPYLHFGHVSAQRVALETGKCSAPKQAKETFLEELIVRRELSDNYCHYNDHYDSFEGFPEWARKTLDRHRRDRREYLYTLRQFEAALTHDEIWNAAQREMLKTGKMHGYMRMYWAKKILEWSASPEDAMQTAIYLNDRYELDGRDPNGYTGIAWSIGGVHDRAWNERPVFGKIRYMSHGGLKRKFDTNAYIKKVDGL